MNKAISDGLVVMPAPFAEGLDVWSCADGTPGSETYAGRGRVVPDDADFAAPLEFEKDAPVERLRYMAETTVLPGCYLRVTARVKAVSGPLPSVRIAGYAGAARGPLGGVSLTGRAVRLTALGAVVEVEAIVGTGNRIGVDLVWPDALYGHFGLDFTGPSGAVVRVESVEIADVSTAFLRDVVGRVDVRDFGAVGDGVTDDAAAFERADAAAQGREMVVSRGVYLLGRDVALDSPLRFEGRVEMPDEARLMMRHSFAFQTYLDAFGDAELAFRKAYQAFMAMPEHSVLDLGGCRIGLRQPLDMQAAAPWVDGHDRRRVIRNGQFYPVAGSNWDAERVTARATYDADQPLTLRRVADAAQIAKGALVTGGGVGREVYVRDVDVAAQTVMLSQALHVAQGTQAFTFTRFKYLLDFSGYDSLSQMVLSDVTLQCDDRASGVMLAPEGRDFEVSGCVFDAPADRGLTSPGGGCMTMVLDRCTWRARTGAARRPVAFNANGAGVTVRDNRIDGFACCAVIAGTEAQISGNRFGRTGALVLTRPRPVVQITGNRIDGGYVEWTEEHAGPPNVRQGGPFGGMILTGNVFSAFDMPKGFRWIVVRPMGAARSVDGVTVANNQFLGLAAAEAQTCVDATFADLEAEGSRSVTIAGNVVSGGFAPALGA